jgi:hypothetical protein
MTTRFFVKQRFGSRHHEIYLHDQPADGFEDHFAAEQWSWENLHGYGEDTNWFIVEERV